MTFWYHQLFQKMNKKNRLYYNDTLVVMFLFVFWEKLKPPKRHFKINWPLATPKWLKAQSTVRNYTVVYNDWFMIWLRVVFPNIIWAYVLLTPMNKNYLYLPIFSLDQLSSLIRTNYNGNRKITDRNHQSWWRKGTQTQLLMVQRK